MSGEEDLAREWAEKEGFEPGTEYDYEHVVEAWVAGWTAACRIVRETLTAAAK
jgi:hypothetical protein